MANTYELVVKTVDQSSRSIKGIEKSLSRLESRSKSVKRAMVGVGAAVVAVVSVNALKSVVNITGRFEDLKSTLGSVYGSAKLGAQAFQDISSLATQTQFGVEDLSNAFIKLKAAGIDPTNKLLQTFTDTAAVTTDQLGTFQAMTDLVTRTTGGGLGLEELNRLADRGIPVFNILTQELGLARQEISEFGKSADGAKKISEALFRGLDKSFGGATEARLGNLSTLVSNLSIAVTKAVAAFGEGLAPALKTIIGEFTGFVDANESVFLGLGKAVGIGLESAANSVKKIADAIGLIQPGGLEKTFASLIDGFASLLKGLDSGIKQIVSGIASIANGFNQIIVSISRIKGSGFTAVFAEDRAGVEAEVARIEAALAPLYAQRAVNQGNETFLEKLGLSPGQELPEIEFKIPGLENDLARAKNNLADFTNESAIILQRFDTSVSTANSGLLEMANNLSAAAAEMRESGVEAESAAGRFSYYNDMTLEMAHRNRAVALTGEDLAMSMTVVSGGINATTTAYNDLLSKTDATIAQQELNKTLIEQITYAHDNGVISTDRYKTALSQLGAEFSNTTVTISEYQKFLDNLTNSSMAEAAQTGFAMTAKGELRQQLENGKISIDAYAVAMERLNSILGTNTSVTTSSTVAAKEQLGVYAQAAKDITDTNASIIETGSALTKLQGDFNSGIYSLDEFRVGMESMGVGMDQITDRGIAMALTVTDAFKQAGDGLANGLAKGILKGEGIMDSFKNFMSSILETILTQIIQQAFIGPMVSSMTSGLGQAFSAFGGGGFGGGAGGGMGFGSMIGTAIGGPIGGFLGGLLPFANGGVIPGQSTRGDSVPILAAPGEVILNKSQQAALLEGGNGGGSSTVNFNINAIDTQSGTQFLMDNKKQMISIIQQANNQRGQRGPLG